MRISMMERVRERERAVKKIKRGRKVRGREGG